jgi:hypothetical protein
MKCNETEGKLEFLTYLSNQDLPLVHPVRVYSHFATQHFHTPNKGCSERAAYVGNGSRQKTLQRPAHFRVLSAETLSRYQANIMPVLYLPPAASRPDCRHWGPRYQTTPSDVGSEVLTAVVMESTIFWDIARCSLLSVNRSFGGTCHLCLPGRRIRQARNQHEALLATYLVYSLTLKMEATSSSETSVGFRQTIWR